MKIESVKAIFTNLLFVIGVGLTIFGFIKGSLTVSKILSFDEYPLAEYKEIKCTYALVTMVEPAVPVHGEGDQKDSPAQSENRQQESERCMQELEKQRKIKKSDDIVVSATTLFSGIVLISVFRKFIFK